MKLLKFKQPYVSIDYNGDSHNYNYLKWKMNKHDLEPLLSSLNKILKNFEIYRGDFKYLPIKIRFSRVLPKTSRIKNIFKCDGLEPEHIGSNYVFKDEKLIHKIDIIYKCSENDIEITLNKIKDLYNNWPSDLEKFINEKKQQYNLIKSKKANSHSKDESKQNAQTFNKLIFDHILANESYRHFEKYYGDLFEIESVELFEQKKFNEGQIITFFDLANFSHIKDLLNKKGIEILDESIVMDQFFNLDLLSLNKILDLYPFLISKASKNLYISTEKIDPKIKEPVLIDKGLDVNGTIGAIDTYGSFKNGWENYIDYVEYPLPKIPGFNFEKDYSHGTSVASLLAGNDIINDRFQDGLGIYKVALFGVLPMGEISLFYFMKIIKRIISENNAIKIWNLSIQSENYAQGISVLGRFFDILQKKYDVLFIVSAGNDKNTISSGADSLSAITVGSLYEDENYDLKITSYSGYKKIFGRFEKPNTYEISNDVQANDASENFKYVIDDSGYITWTDGTSFSAPLTARKCCYLLNKYNLSLESIKAIINLLSKVSSNKLPNILFDDDTNNILLLIEGEIKPKESKLISINLPLLEAEKNKKSKFVQNFTYATSTSYIVVPSNKLGDEYSSINLEAKIVCKKGKKGYRDIYKSPDTEKVDGIDANENDLLNHFKKYDPNRVLKNKDFNKPKKYSILNDELYLKVKCLDLYDTHEDSVKYAFAVLLKEASINALKEFEQNNAVNIVQDVKINLGE
ncbi:hypothetical protein SHELI_v1c09870 [Spiroplasma helicoides]|uniref:Peptidase S8/S53 domain-containing protein n=1 Tax=Spiroplasma helicoides TaxID=216938 RepID=A0A1B3SLX9_9MOLU|nr:S8 family serine peptidase [Spiroplasma helicoides]AOG60934.1 hypothetical protein SHELI_v1c09870 [Spiroplasma helicoides]